MPDHVLEKSIYDKRGFYGLLFLYGIVLISGAIFIRREEFHLLLLWQIVLHACYIIAYRKRSSLKLNYLLWAAVLMRVGIAFISPSLSEDVYRFLWDGNLMLQGDNPMLSSPDGFIAALPGDAPNKELFFSLHALINHPQYYTCYPPVMQGVFWFSALAGFNTITVGIVIIKLLLALADGFTILFLVKILKNLKLDTTLVVLYALHPLVIVEGSGNAHFEVMQATFITGSIYFLLIRKNYLSAICWGLAIATKLLPLLLLPLWWLHLGLKKGLRFCCISVAILVIFFLPFLSRAAIFTFSQTVNLFIQRFEFNASIYYLAREVGFWATGYNQVAILGPALLGLFLIVFAAILLKQRSTYFNQFIYISLLLYCLYFLFSTTVHPWYLITLLPFAIITGNFFPFLWMSVAFLSYSAYASQQVNENPWLILLEYGSVVVLFIIEWRKKNRHLFGFNSKTLA